MTMLEIADLSVRFEGRSASIQAVDRIDLAINSGDRIAIVGESGCGKTVLGLSVMQMLPSNARTGGSIRYRGKNLLEADKQEMQQIRGGQIAMICQNSSLALNPVMTTGNQIMEALSLHTSLRGDELRRETIRLLENLGIAHPEQSMRLFPHEYSGGMRERILVGMALACNPDIIIADEPTSGLDAIVKAQILLLLKEILHDRTLLLITHDLGTASAITSTAAVVYAGEIVEYGQTRDVFSRPMHPYTQGLLASLPSAGFHPIPGMSPPPGRFPGGCRFFPRCSCATGQCSAVHPPLRAAGQDRKVRCHRYD
jgi:peptide/nickel transport system ATP-binding protein